MSQRPTPPATVPTVVGRALPTRPSSGGQARAEQTRALLIGEAVACIRQEGFSAASAKRIAERAGVTWGVIQYHFGDRKGLLAAVVDASFERLHTALTRVVEESPPDPVRAVVTTSWASMRTDLSLAAFEIVIATRPQRGESVSAELLDMAQQMLRLGEVLTRDRDLPPATARRVGAVLFATLRGMAMAQLTIDTPIDQSREQEMLVELITSYLDHAG